MRPQLKGAASIEQRQVDRLRLIYDARQVKQRLGKSVLGSIDQGWRQIGWLVRQHRLRQLASRIVLDEPLIEQVSRVGAAMTLVKIGNCVGQSPVELASHLKGLFKILFRRVG